MNAFIHAVLEHRVRLSTSPHSPDHRDVLAALRDATGSRHASIDSSMPLSTDAIAPRDYCLHLQLIAVWIAPLEALATA